MKILLKNIIRTSIQNAEAKGALSQMDTLEFDIEAPKMEAHGDFSTNAALVMAKQQKMAPRKIAEIICQYMEDPNNIIQKTEIAGPGFINFFIEPEGWQDVLK